MWHVDDGQIKEKHSFMKLKFKELKYEQGSESHKLTKYQDLVAGEERQSYSY